MKQANIYFSFLFGALVLGFYTNCGGSFSAQGNLSSTSSLGGDFCDTVLNKAFNSGIYSFLRTNCKACHESGPGQGLFANSDQNIAFATFKSFGFQRISENAVDNSHASGFTGDPLKPQVNELNQSWANTQKEYNECLASRNSKAKSQFDLLTSEVSFMVNDEWQTLSWDLNHNRFPGNEEHTIDATFKVDVKNYYGEGEQKPEEPIGLLLSQPRLAFTGEQNKIYMEGVLLQSNGVALEDFEAWSQLILIVDKQKESMGIVPDSVIINEKDRNFIYVYSDQQPSIDRLNLSFINIINNTGGANDHLVPDEPNTIDATEEKPIITRNITYADLTGMGEFAVFKNSCYRCHGNGEQRGGFAIDNIAQAKTRRDLIIKSINDPIEPMPLGGRLSLKDIAIIEKWVSDGAL